MNFSKSILSVALLVSCAAASAVPGVATVKALWARVPSRQAVIASVSAQATIAQAKVAPFVTKKNAAIVAGVSAVTAGSVVAYNKGYFGKAAKAVANGFSAVRAKFARTK